MFKVYDKYDQSKIYLVYSVKYNDKETKFLIYWRNKWIWVFSEEYIPLDDARE